MRPRARPVLIAATLVAVPLVAGAQPAPGPAPTTEAPPPDVPPAPIDAPVAPEPLPPSPPVEEPPPAPARASAPAVKVSYDKGILFASDDDAFQLRMGLRTQFRLEMVRALERDEGTATLYIPRARLSIDGHVFGKDTRYKLELALGDRGSFSFVRDLYVERKLAAAPVWVRIGEWKRPFNRQELVADFASELNERAITAELAGGGRALGVALHDDYEKSPEGLEWVVGVFNTFSGGSDRPIIDTRCEQDLTEIECTTPAPANFSADFSPAIVARAGWNHGGIKGYSEGDLEGGPLRYAIGAAYKIDLADLDQGEQASYADNLSHGVQVDAMVKAHGTSLELGGYLMKLKAASARLGGFVQAGYFVLPRRAQVAARFALVEEAGARSQLEARAAFSWFFQGHAYKLASDAGVLQRTGEDAMGNADEPDLQVRVMAQLTL